MMNGRRKSDRPVVATKPANKAGVTARAARGGAGGAKGSGQREAAAAKHEPGTGPGQSCKVRWGGYGKQP